jgi:hypothetical protein
VIRRPEPRAFLLGGAVGGLVLLGLQFASEADSQAWAGERQDAGCRPVTVVDQVEGILRAPVTAPRGACCRAAVGQFAATVVAPVRRAVFGRSAPHRCVATRADPL